MDLFAPVADIIHYSVIDIRYSCAASCGGILPLDAESVYRISELVTLFYGRTVDSAEAHYFIAYKRIRDKRCRLVLKKVDVICLEIELLSFCHDLPPWS